MANTYTIEVTLNTSGSPAVSVNTDSLPVDFGTDTIYWIPTSSQVGEWEFKSISFSPSGPFGEPNIQANTLSVLDDDDANSTETYSYTLYVKEGNTIYDSDPFILNEPQGG